MKAKTREPQPRNSAAATARKEISRVLGKSTVRDELDRIIGNPPKMQKFTLTFFPWAENGDADNDRELINQELWLTALDSRALAVQLARAAKPFLPKSVC